MKGYKGFEPGLVCRGKQYAENTVFEEDSAVICSKGMHFCELPHRVFEYYSPGENHEFAEVEALDAVKTDDDVKYCTRKLRIGAKISVFDIAKISVSAFFEKFDFCGKIAKTKEKSAANAGNFGAANAGYCGAANAGDCGAANAGDCGAANAGNFGAANAGNFGAANAGNKGAAIVRTEGSASVGENGLAAALGNGGKVKGKLGAILVLTAEDDHGNIIDHAVERVDGEKIKEDVFYTLKEGEFVEC